MSGLIDKALGNVTAIPRKLNIIPEETKTSQGIIDLARGKIKPTGKSLLGKPIKIVGQSVGKKAEGFLTGKVR